MRGGGRERGIILAPGCLFVCLQIPTLSSKTSVQSATQKDGAEAPTLRHAHRQGLGMCFFFFVCIFYERIVVFLFRISCFSHYFFRSCLFYLPFCYFLLVCFVFMFVYHFVQLHSSLIHCVYFFITSKVSAVSLVCNIEILNIPFCLFSFHLTESFSMFYFFSGIQ